ncbi:hypothetical protein ACFYZE_32720 [Streptomyces sp. NPDC001796]
MGPERNSNTYFSINIREFNSGSTSAVKDEIDKLAGHLSFGVRA